jgi:hypothetical protein
MCGLRLCGETDRHAFAPSPGTGRSVCSDGALRPEVGGKPCSNYEADRAETLQGQEDAQEEELEEEQVDQAVMLRTAMSDLFWFAEAGGEVETSGGERGNWLGSN